MNYYIEFNELPFEVDKQQVVYVENTFNKGINDYIVEYYDDICEVFKENYLEFCYIPKLNKRLAQKEYLNYFAPYQTDYEYPKNETKSFDLLDFMAHQENRRNIKPSFVFDCNMYHRENVLLAIPIEDYISSFESFDEQAKDGIVQMINVFKDIKSSNTIRYHISFGDIPDDADGRFDIEAKQLIEEIKTKVELLHQKGISSFLIEQLIYKDEILSDLHITKDNKIILTDYNNMEIKMYPLTKAVYFLFLKHLDGILFKNLSDYTDELTEIYANIKQSKLKREEIKRIEDITNPLSNSINEKCSRIREAFLSNFDERLAKYYYINGKRGEEKKILLPSHLVFWD